MYLTRWGQHFGEAAATSHARQDASVCRAEWECIWKDLVISSYIYAKEHFEPTEAKKLRNPVRHTHTFNFYIYRDLLVEGATSNSWSTNALGRQRDVCKLFQWLGPIIYYVLGKSYLIHGLQFILRQLRRSMVTVPMMHCQWCRYAPTRHLKKLT